MAGARVYGVRTLCKRYRVKLDVVHTRLPASLKAKRKNVFVTEIDRSIDRGGNFTNFFLDVVLFFFFLSNEYNELMHVERLELMSSSRIILARKFSSDRYGKLGEN